MTTKAIQLGGGDGTAIPAGMVGYVYESQDKNTSSLTNGQFFDAMATPINLPVGNYLVISRIRIITTGSPTTVRVKNYGFGTIPGNNSTGVVEAFADEYSTSNSTAYSSGMTVTCVRKQTITNSSQNYYVKGFYFAAGTPGTATLDAASVIAIAIP